MVRIILAYGADLNATSGVKTGKWTPLIKAVQASNIGMVQALINRDAKISANTLPIASGAELQPGSCLLSLLRFLWYGHIHASEDCPRSRIIIGD